MSRLLITTVPFGGKDGALLKRLDALGVDYIVNPIGRKLKESELAELISDCEVVIAGTEVISEKVLSRAKSLKLISRVGVGLDNVDLLAAKSRGVMVSYTPDAPAPAVAELTVGLMFSLLRSIHISNSELHAGKWNRYFGRRISEVDIGLIGAGRIGTQVLHLLSGMGVKTILVNEIRSDLPAIPGLNIEWVDKEVIYRNADIISLHVPLTALTSNMITSKELSFMKPDAMLINTARGGIINEKDLESILASGMLSGVAIDVFNEEPYFGPLRLVERCLLTAHMGSMSIDCRTRMEVEATEEAIRFFTGIPLKNLVPEEEYKLKHQEV